MNVPIGQIGISYNNYVFSPTPLLSQNLKPIILNGAIWGYENEILLRGYYTGVLGWTGVYEAIANIFTGNFGNLQVWDSTGTSPIYNWNYLAVTDISVDPSQYPQKAFVNYDVRLINYEIPSGIINATNDYVFNQNEDGTADLTRRVSAQGVRTNIDPLTNAINYVSLLTGQSLISPVFIQYGNPILMSINELIDRTNSTYEINLGYQFMTGITGQNFLQIANLNINQSNDQDYITLDYNVHYDLSPITGNISGLESYINTNNYLNEISTTYNISSPNIYQSSFEIKQDLEGKKVEVKSSYISGISNNDISGYFDYVITLDKDLIAQKSMWAIEGNYISKGPLNFRRGNISYFKSISNPYISYLSALITNSPLNYYYGNSNVSPLGQIIGFKTYENTGMAIFRLELSSRDLDSAYGLINPKFQIDYVPPKWNFSAIPAANIEGLYAIQDLQSLSQSKISINTSCESSGNGKNFNNLNILFNNLSGAYVQPNAFIENSSIESGILYQNMVYNYLMSDVTGGTSFSTYKVIGGVSSNYNRPSNYLFGL